MYLKVIFIFIYRGILTYFVLDPKDRDQPTNIDTDKHLKSEALEEGSLLKESIEGGEVKDLGKWYIILIYVYMLNNILF